MPSIGLANATERALRLASQPNPDIWNSRLKRIIYAVTHEFICNVGRDGFRGRNIGRPAGLISFCDFRDAPCI